MEERFVFNSETGEIPLNGVKLQKYQKYKSVLLSSDE